MHPCVCEWVSNGVYVHAFERVSVCVRECACARAFECVNVCVGVPVSVCICVCVCASV